MTAALTASMSPAEREQLVARIAAEVVRRLSVAPPQAATAVSAPQPSASATATAAEAAGTGPMLAEKVIVLATVARLPRDLREVTVRQDAVLTPSAREWLADHRIAIRRIAASAASATPAASPASLVAASDLPARAAGQAAAVARASARWPAAACNGACQPDRRLRGSGLLQRLAGPPTHPAAGCRGPDGQSQTNNPGGGGHERSRSPCRR